jgi:hypothetical protein
MLKCTPIWDEVGWHGIHGEGEGYGIGRSGDRA